MLLSTSSKFFNGDHDMTCIEANIGVSFFTPPAAPCSQGRLQDVVRPLLSGPDWEVSLVALMDAIPEFSEPLEQLLSNLRQEQT